MRKDGKNTWDSKNVGIQIYTILLDFKMWLEDFKKY